MLHIEFLKLIDDPLVKICASFNCDFRKIEVSYYSVTKSGQLNIPLTN